MNISDLIIDNSSNTLNTCYGADIREWEIAKELQNNCSTIARTALADVLVVYCYTTKPISMC
ncbi:MAG: hypothetical protein WCC17_11085 [Candidatus Nitrosopolaris sp.]